MPWKYVFAWLPLPLFGALSGFLRTYVYGRYWVYHRDAYWISPFVTLGMIFAYALLIGRRSKFESNRRAFYAGLVWAVLSVAYEYVRSTIGELHPLLALTSDISIIDNRVWWLQLLFIALTPLLVHLIYRKNEDRTRPRL